MVWPRPRLSVCLVRTGVFRACHSCEVPLLPGERLLIVFLRNNRAPGRCAEQVFVFLPFLELRWFYVYVAGGEG